MTIDTRAIGACVLACAVTAATVAPAETNWDALSSAGWSDTRSDGDRATASRTEEAQSAAQDLGGTRLVQATASASPAGTEITQAFVKLGMAEARATCFGEVLAKQLSPEEQQEAAQLVSEAKDAADVKTNVITAGATMVGGFSAADASCPEDMGS